MDKGDLQSTLLEGHGTAPPDLDLSAINGMWGRPGRRCTVGTLCGTGVCPRLASALSCLLSSSSECSSQAAPVVATSSQPPHTVCAPPTVLVDRSMVRKTPQLEKMLSRKPKATSFMAPQRKGLVSMQQEDTGPHWPGLRGLAPSPHAY